MTMSYTQVEVKWHREDFTNSTATIALAYYLVDLAQKKPKLKYAIPEGNPLKVAGSLVASCRDQRARGMWVVVSKYLREIKCLDQPDPAAGDAGERLTWPWRLAESEGGGTIELDWKPAEFDHGAPHGLPDELAEEDVHDAHRYDTFQKDPVAFIKAARDVKNCYWALTEQEAEAPMKCFPDGNVTVFHRRQPPHRVLPEYANLKVGKGLIVFTLERLHDGRTDAEVLREAKASYLRAKAELVKRCWRHWCGNLLRVSDEYGASVAAAVAAGHRAKDEDLVAALIEVETKDGAAEDAAVAAEDESGPGEEDGPENLDKVEDYSLTDDTGATLESRLHDLREAVETSETVAQTAQRVFGVAHEITQRYERELLDARAALRALEVPVEDLRVDDRVDCYHDVNNIRGWFSATVTSLCGDDKYGIDYDDEHRLRPVVDVPARYLRRRAARYSKLLFEGDFMMVNWMGLGTEEEALLWKRRGVDGFDVIRYDGKIETCVPVSRMRRVREEDRKAWRKLTLAEYGDPTRKLARQDIEEADRDDLKAALSCQGMRIMDGRKPAMKARLLRLHGFDVPLKWVECVNCKKWRYVAEAADTEGDWTCAWEGRSCDDPPSPEEAAALAEQRAVEEDAKTGGNVGV